MCITKNKQIEETLKIIREIEKQGFSNITDDSIISSLVNIDIVEREMKEFKNIFKQEIIKRGILLSFIPELEKKVEIKEGNQKTEYNIRSIYEKCRELKGGINKFLGCIKFVEKIAKEEQEDIYYISQKHKKIAESKEKVVKIGKMTKKELIETKK